MSNAHKIIKKINSINENVTVLVEWGLVFEITLKLHRLYVIHANQNNLIYKFDTQIQWARVFLYFNSLNKKCYSCQLCASIGIAPVICQLISDIHAFYWGEITHQTTICDLFCENDFKSNCARLQISMYKNHTIWDRRHFSMITISVLFNRISKNKIVVISEIQRWKIEPATSALVFRNGIAFVMSR